MAISKKIDNKTNGPGKGDGRHVVYSEQFNNTVSQILDIQDTEGELKADTIAESTSGSGVTVDGVLLQDNDVTATDITANNDLTVTNDATVTNDFTVTGSNIALGTHPSNETEVQIVGNLILGGANDVGYFHNAHKLVEHEDFLYSAGAIDAASNWVATSGTSATDATVLAQTTGNGEGGVIEMAAGNNYDFSRATDLTQIVNQVPVRIADLPFIEVRFAIRDDFSVNIFWGFTDSTALEYPYNVDDYGSFYGFTNDATDCIGVEYSANDLDNYFGYVKAGTTSGTDFNLRDCGFQTYVGSGYVTYRLQFQNSGTVDLYWKDETTGLYTLSRSKFVVGGFTNVDYYPYFGVLTSDIGSVDDVYVDYIRVGRSRNGNIS
jgi:hypothetical protein